MLADILHKIAEFDAEESHPYSPRPSISGPDRCIRQLDYYAQNWMRQPFPGRFITVLDDSSWHEQLVKDWIRKSVFELHSEQMEVICGHVSGRPMKGHIDGIITDILGIDRLIEIKAINHFSFQDTWNGHPPLDYITQTMLYLRGVKEINPDINQALLFMKNKNQSQYLEFLMTYDAEADNVLIHNMVLSTGETKDLGLMIENVTRSAIERFEEIELFRAEKKLHDRPYDRDDWHCQYCPYGDLCWAGWEDEFEAREVDVELDGAISEICRQYIEVSSKSKQIEDEKDALQDLIKKALIGANARKARAGAYVITNSLRKRKNIDKSLIPPMILEQALKESTFEVLNVRNVRKEKGK